MKPIFTILAPCILLASTLALRAVQGDRDEDGLRDEVETDTGEYISQDNTGTDPDRPDTDGDSVPDGLEVNHGTNPSSFASHITRPNIILINCDDLGYGDVGCFWQNQRTGTQKFATPGLDAMASSGVMLTQHYAASPVCASSRASLMQGRHQGHADIRDSQFDYALPNNHSIASVLKSAGYHTVHIGKAGLAGNIPNSATSAVGLPAHPLFRGFDRFFGYYSHYHGHEHYPRNGTTEKGAWILDDFQKILNANIDLYTTDAWTAFAKKTIIDDTQNSPTRPFFLYLAFDAPHFKNQVPPTRDYPIGKGLNGGIQWTGSPAYASTSSNDPLKVDNIVNQHSSVNPAWPDIQRRQVSMIRRIDDAVADVLQTLRDLHIDENTLVVFTSDNGPTIEDGQDPRFFRSFANFEGLKRDIWEGGIREPTIVWWPGHIPANNPLSNIRVSAIPSAHWDWLPTFAQLAGVPAPSYTDGISLVPTLTATGVQRPRDYLYFEFNNPGGATLAIPEFANHGWDLQNQSQAIRIGDLMGVRVNIAGAEDNFRIYNVVSDPGQGVNIAPGRPDLQQKMKDIAISGRRPLEGVSRPYDTANLPAVNPGPVTNGVRYRSFEGHWPWLPEFQGMNAAKSGITSKPDPAVRSRDKDVGISFTGYLSIPTTGNYSFDLGSDSGSNLWIHESHVIDNDFNRTPTKSSGPVFLSAGLHPLRLYYRHQDGVPVLNLRYSGPGIPLQIIPASAYFTDGPAPVIQLQPDATVVRRNTPDTVDALANDTSNYPLALLSAGPSSKGRLALASGRVEFTPSVGFIGTDSFTYSVSGGTGTASSTITASVLFDNEFWMPFDENSGDIVKGVSPTQPFSGTLVGTTTPESSWIDGRFNNCLAFDGVDDQVNIPNLLLPTGNSSRTFACWVKTNNKISSEIQTLFSYGDSSTGKLFAVRVHNIPNLARAHPARLEVFGGTVVGTKPLNDGLWHHLAVVVSDRNNDSVLNVSETLFYVDGILDPVSISSPLEINTGNTLVPCVGGSNHASNHHFNGNIDDIRIFPKALSAAEVADLSNTVVDFVAGNQDNDGDGASDYAEFTAGTDPNNPHSIFRITSTSITAQGLVLHWSALAGKIYQIEESPDLQDWSPVPGIATVAPPSPIADANITIPPNDMRKRFLRISVR